MDGCAEENIIFKELACYDATLTSNTKLDVEKQSSLTITPMRWVSYENTDFSYEMDDIANEGMHKRFFMGQSYIQGMSFPSEFNDTCFMHKIIFDDYLLDLYERHFVEELIIKIKGWPSKKILQCNIVWLAGIVHPVVGMESWDSHARINL